MEQIFLQILNMSITAGYCIVIVLILRQLLRRVPKRYSYVLWSVVYFRLACPASFKSMLSLIKVNTQTIPQDIGMQEMPQIASGMRSVDTVVNYSMRQVITQAKPEYSINPMQKALFVAGVIWAVIAVSLFLHGLWSSFQLKRQLGNAQWIEENIYEVDNLPTAFVFGIFTPRIYLPSGLTGGNREAVIEHEKMHIRRRDYLIKPMAFLLTCIHWFNPLVWLSFQLLCRDMEMSCDERVIRRIGGERKKEYSAALLSLAADKKVISGSSIAFGEGAVRKRIMNVLSYRRLTFWAHAFVVVLLTAVLIGLALDPQMEVLGAKGGRLPGIPTEISESAGQSEGLEDDFDTKDVPNVTYAEHRPGYENAVLHLYFPTYTLESDYVDTEWLTSEESDALAQQAIQELYDVTGTQIEECYYYYTTWGVFSFGLTEDDMEHQRCFLYRTFGAHENDKMTSIASMYVVSARRVWFSSVYQYELPADYEAMTDVERAIWFLKHSGLYNGQTVAECFRPYEGMPETWRIVMEDDTTYEITLDDEIDSFHDIVGPYPDSDIRH